MAAIFVLTTIDRDAVVDAPRSVFTHVQPNSENITSPITVAVNFTTPPPLLSPGYSGVVERSLVTAGDTITTGTPILTVDGIDRIAAYTPQPFSRPLGPDDRGTDVTNLNTLLRQMGYAAGGSDVYSQSTERGVQQLADKLSYASGRDLTPTAFDPTWVVYLSTSTFVAEEVFSSAGALAPAQGEVLVKGLPNIESAVLQTFVQNGATTPDETAGSTPSTTPEDTPDSTSSNSQVAAASFTAPPTATILASGSELAINEDRQSIGAESFPTLLQLLEPNSTTIQAQVAIPPEAGQFIVPPASIFVGEGGATCVLVGNEQHAVGTTVQVIANLYERVIVTGPLSGTDQVAVSPPAALRTCAN